MTALDEQIRWGKTYQADHFAQMYPVVVNTIFVANKQVLVLDHVPALSLD